MITKAAQEPNQQRRSILRLCFERTFVATHGGKRSRSDRSGWDGGAGTDSTREGFGEETSKEGVLGFEDMKLEEERKRPHASEIMNSDAKTAPVIERNVEC